MRRDPALVAAGALCGLAWGHEGFAWLIGLAALVPLLWQWCRSRWTAGATALAFYLAASRGLPFGAGIFFAATAPAWFSWALWLAAGLVNAALWFALWNRDRIRRVYMLPVILALTAIPPLGVIGWTNPLTAAAIYYPSMGFIGLAFFVGLVGAAMLGRWEAVAIFAGAAVVANVSAAAWPKDHLPALASWSAHNTHFHRLQSDSIAQVNSRVQFVVDLAQQLQPGQVVVLPETLLPADRREIMFAWLILGDAAEQLRAKNAMILVGSELAQPGAPTKNALIALGEQGNKPLVQRVPVPIGMWRPWDKETFAADLFGSGIAELRGRKVAYSICYEQLLVYPVLFSMAHSPDVLVGAANDWWARDTSIPAIQGQALDLWGRLFAVPVIRATNI